MRLFYVKDGAPFVPEAINPELAHIAKAIVKTCRLTFKLQLKTNAIANAMKKGDVPAMDDLLQKALAKNRSAYNSDMALTGVKVGEVDDDFFADKDAAFYQNQLGILLDFAAINCVVEARMFPLMANACEKTLNKPINKVLFFTNQTVILEEEEEEAEEAGQTEEPQEDATEE